MKKQLVSDKLNEIFDTLDMCADTIIGMQENLEEHSDMWEVFQECITHIENAKEVIADWEN